MKPSLFPLTIIKSVFGKNRFLAVAFDERGFFMVNKEGLELALIEAPLG